MSFLFGSFSWLDLDHSALCFRKSKDSRFLSRIQSRCQFAEFLKLGITDLIVQMSEADFLTDAPILKSPVNTLKLVSSNLDLSSEMLMKNGQKMSPIEVQRWYLERAKLFLKDRVEVQLENREVVRFWEETLDTLESNPEKLIGRIDWITKRYLLETSGADLDYWQRKKIDLRYHELGNGYFDRLRGRGLTLDFYQDDEIEEAVKEPSSPGRVRLRSRLIKSIALKDQYMTISWSQVKVGRWRPKLIKLDDFRKRHSDQVDS